MDYRNAYKYQQKQLNKEERLKSFEWGTYSRNNREYSKYKNTKHVLWKHLTISKRKEVLESYFYGIPKSKYWTNQEVKQYHEFKGEKFIDFLDYLMEEVDEFIEIKCKIRDNSLKDLLK
jgi:hypothetical protein